MLKARADALHQQAHRLAGDFDKALYAQDIMRESDFREPRDKRRWVRRGRDLDDETVEIVVIVILQPIVMRRAIGEIVFGGGGEAKQYARIDGALSRAQNLRGAERWRAASPARPPPPLRSADRSC